MLRKHYVAYGSNMNLEQMSDRCPTAKLVGVGEIPGYRLQFNGVATIVPEAGGSVPALIWSIRTTDEDHLDIYEGFPHLYRKEQVTVSMNGKNLQCMVYIMNHSRPAPPSSHYFDCILQGYQANGIDLDPLFQAVRE